MPALAYPAEQESPGQAPRPCAIHWGQHVTRARASEGHSMSIRTAPAWVMAAALTSLYAGCGSPGTPAGDASVVTPCTSHADCDDELFCTGPELCMPSSPDALANGCLLGALPCAAASCDEAADMCETGCEDADGDGHPDAACGGDDCDDDDDQRFPGNNEVCDLTSHDEDCDPCTVGDAGR
jgi:hypothetical protein